MRRADWPAHAGTRRCCAAAVTLPKNEEGGAARVRKGINVDRLFLPIGVIEHQVPPPRYCWLRTRDELIGRP